MHFNPIETNLIPNTVIAGFPKAGTSSLWYWLSAHPDVCASKVKETYYLFDNVIPLNKQANFHDHGWEGYSKHFRHYQGEKVILEATPVYFNRETPLNQLSRLEPLPNIIFMVREPSQRIFSYYRFHKYRLKTVSKTTDFNQFLTMKADKLTLNNYIEQLKPWIEAMGREHIGVFLMEEMQADSINFMKKVSRFSGIDPAFYDTYNFPLANPTVQIKNLWLHNLSLKLQHYIPRTIRSNFLNPLYLKLNAKKLPPPSADDLEAQKALKARFEPYNQELAEQFNLDLSYWE